MEEKRISVTLSEREFICSELRQIYKRLWDASTEIDEMYFELCELVDRIQAGVEKDE